MDREIHSEQGAAASATAKAAVVVGGGGDTATGAAAEAGGEGAAERAPRRLRPGWREREAGSRERLWAETRRDEEARSARRRERQSSLQRQWGRKSSEGQRGLASLSPKPRPRLRRPEPRSWLPLGGGMEADWRRVLHSLPKSLPAEEECAAAHPAAASAAETARGLVRGRACRADATATAAEGAGAGVVGVERKPVPPSCTSPPTR